jgi:hypothetical protein
MLHGADKTYANKKIVHYKFKRKKEVNVDPKLWRSYQS